MPPHFPHLLGYQIPIIEIIRFLSIRGPPGTPGWPPCTPRYVPWSCPRTHTHTDSSTYIHTSRQTHIHTHKHTHTHTHTLTHTLCCSRWSTMSAFNWDSSIIAISFSELGLRSKNLRIFTLVQGQHCVQDNIWVSFFQYFSRAGTSPCPTYTYSLEDICYHRKKKKKKKKKKKSTFLPLWLKSFELGVEVCTVGVCNWKKVINRADRNVRFPWELGFWV